MASFRDFVVQGGLGIQSAQAYDEQQAARAHAARVREHGVKTMESDERRRAAADALLDQETVIKRLRADVEKAQLTHTKKMQPGQHRLEQRQQGVAAGVTNLAEHELREKEGAAIWGLVSVGDMKGALDLLNKSERLQPGRKFSAIERGGAPARGQDGKPLVGADGKPVVEKLVRLVAADGGQDVIIPQQTLESNAEKHGSRYEKVGNNYIKIDRTGKVTPVYEPEQYIGIPEGGTVASNRTGRPAAAAGVNAPPPGSDRATARVDDRVQQGTAIVNRYFGISEFTGLDQRNQPKYNRIVGLMGEKVRAGMNPEAAATAAINEINHADAARAAGGRPGGDAAYSGPAPWRQ
jgi:hypothetical protein